MNTLDEPDAPGTAAVDPQDEALRLFRDHGDALYRFCRSVVGSTSDAEDVVQETFLKLLRHLRSGGARGNLKSWLFTVAANACRDQMRWRLRWRPWRQEEDTRSVEPAEDMPDVRRARAIMRSLAPRDRLLLSLRAQGLSYREIAGAAGIQERSVGRLLARAMARWKRSLNS